MGKGGGGSQPAPSSQTVSNTSIPSYAQPYVEDMLGRTAALTDINQNPYESYGGQRVAGFTPLQTQAMENVGNMQIAPQIGQATGYAGQAGQGMLGTTSAAMGYGQQGAGYGQQATGAGQAYQNMATDPAEMQKYMNPYIQQALNPQLALLNQQQALQGQGISAKASGQGAFGGNRATLAQGLNAQNYALAGQQAIGQGYSDAFKQAQQAQQFGADIGLRGLQTGIQGANTGLQGINAAQAGYSGANQAAATLGQLGQTQYGQQMGINQAQMQAGAMQQGLQQQGLDNAYQDFLKQKNYPYQQLAFQSDQLRGLPLSQSAQTMYTAPPSYASQIGGAGTAALGIYGMSGGFRAKGGMVGEGYAEGGQIGYSLGGDIKSMSAKQLTEMLNNPTLTPMEESMIEERLMLLSRMKNNPETGQIMGLGSQSQGGGLDTIPSGDTFEAAGGGIVAFAGKTDGSLVQANPTDDYLAQYTDKKGNVDLNKAALSLLGQARPSSETDSAARQEILSDIKNRQEMRPYELLTRFGLGAMAGKDMYPGVNFGTAGIDTMNSYSKDLAAEQSLKRELARLDAEGAAKDDSRRLQLAGTLLNIQGHKDARAAAMANAPDAETKALQKAQLLINSDDQLPLLYKQRDMYEPNDPKYKSYNDAINSIKKGYFDQVGIKRPYVSAAPVQFPVEPEKESFLSRINPFSSKPAAPAASPNKVIPYNQLPT